MTVGVIYLYSWPWPSDQFSRSFEFQDHFLKMETPIFDTGFEKSREFYVRNGIFKFVVVTLRSYIQGQIVKKCSEAVYSTFWGIWE